LVFGLVLGTGALTFGAALRLVGALGHLALRLGALALALPLSLSLPVDGQLVGSEPD
jgi:hypothetical protein